MESPNPIQLGKSLLVPSVQELAKQSLDRVPSRYLRPDQDPPTISDVSMIQTVPIIDLQSLLSPGPIGDSELERFDSACKEWGFFQLINHGVSLSLLERVKLDVEDLFRLSVEEKKKYWQLEGEVEGFGQAFVISNEQKLDWADTFFLTTLPLYGRKPHLFPKLPPSFRDTLESYSSELKDVAEKLIKSISAALQMESQVMSELFEDGIQGMRMNYYPPCPQPEHVIGLTPHSDAAGLTILFQLNETEGLQIRKDGAWLPVKPLPNAFVVNIGDILEILTNGKYQSVQHRATVNSKKERLSLATFYSPSLEKEIGPQPSLLTPQTPALFKRIGIEEYVKGLFSRELDGKSYLDVMRIQANTIN